MANMGAPYDPKKRMTSKPNKGSYDAQQRSGADTPEQVKARQTAMDQIANQVNKAGVSSTKKALSKMGYK